MHGTMRLSTLGGVALDDVAFSRPKPLLLLAYLTLEGRQPRRRVAELFWPEASDRMKTLTVTLARLRRGAPGAIEADAEHVWATVETDAERFLAALHEERYDEALALYEGPFLAGLRLTSLGMEIEEWLYLTREFLAGHARRALLSVAERHAEREAFGRAAARAEEAYRLDGAPAPDHDDLRRMHTLLCAGHSPDAARVLEEAADLGLEVASSFDEARGRLTRTRPQVLAPPSTLPRRGTAFVGRDLELTEIATLVAAPECALLTLVGPPGIGKTRLAEHVAHEVLATGTFADGVCHVPTGQLDSATELPRTLAGALGAAADAAGSTLDAVCEAIGTRDLLLVLDDVEHLVSEREASAPDGAATLSTLLRRCQNLTVLVTSRQRLALEFEHVFTVDGLAYPERAQVTAVEARRFDAVALFERRARRTLPGFVVDDKRLAGVLEICALVEGLPLALELAASWVRVMSVDEIARELARDLDLLVTNARDAPPRARSMRAALEHSWRLLSRHERNALRALALCADGFRRDAASAVAGATIPVLAALVDTSLVRADGSGRYGLHPLVRHDAVERANARPDEARRTRLKHRRHYVDLLRAWESALAGSDRQREALVVLEEALPNVLRAWHAAAEDGATDDLWDACRPLQLFFIQRGGMARTAVEAFAAASERLAAHQPTHHALLGRLRAAEAWFRFGLGDVRRCRGAAEHALALLRSATREPAMGNGAAAEASDERGRALTRAEISSLNTLSTLAKHEGDLHAAGRHLDEALHLARARDEEAQIAILTNNLALLKKATGAFDEAERLIVEALRRNRERGNLRSVVRNLINLGSLLVVAGRPAEAETQLEEGTRLEQDLGYEATLPDLITNLGGAAHARGDTERARTLYLDALERAEATGDRTLAARSHCRLGRIESERCDHDAARHHFGHALALARHVGDAQVIGSCLLGLAHVRLEAGHAGEAATLVGALDRHGVVEDADAPRLAAIHTALDEALPAPALHAALSEGAERPVGEFIAEMVPFRTPRA